MSEEKIEAIAEKLANKAIARIEANTQKSVDMAILAMRQSVATFIEERAAASEKDFDEKMEAMHKGAMMLQEKANEERDTMANGFSNMSDSIEEIKVTLVKMDERFDRIDVKFEKVEERFVEIDKKFDAIDKKFDAIDKKFDKMDQRFDGVDQRLGNLESDVREIKDYVKGNVEKRVHTLELHRQSTTTML